MTKKILILNGPNLNMLGIREPEVYGRNTLNDIKALCLKKGDEEGFDISFHQSNSENELIEMIHDARDNFNGIIINPASYTHTSVAILDALLSTNLPTIEVHLTNLYKRESFRQNSITAKAAYGLICGFGMNGYALAISALKEIIIK